MSLHLSSHLAELPEFVISGDTLQEIGFMADALFHIAQFSNGLILSLIEPETGPDLATLFHEIECDPHQGIDGVRDNGELYLVGDWLTESGLLDHPVTIETAYGTIVIKAELPVLLA
ncbi:SymE family type I addiction module toxin [Xenorhabdus anantnagensis]|uniref:SymE family type I addiction module toxin n=1 Tax=Xenorhabdus anantnagensis TaxID=3025875 RepID=A0ABT5LYR1_9GAMM|nr:SymE family type I addiction module toxin [Xenorhabdus anantnagensis]MDC9598896.1 SymE family type I addiction module toxin [Xenorhabdus anantnagensis]